MLYGAIIGDIAGSLYEFNNCTEILKGKLLPAQAFFTDDTVMTIATADAILKNEGSPNFAKAYRKWGLKYPNRGYGARFLKWLHTPGMGPYNSYGNGSAMRISPCAYLSNQIRHDVVVKSAEATHNHPDGIFGAIATTSAIYMAHRGDSKDSIRRVLEPDFEIPTCDEIRPAEFDETCMGTIPLALAAFFEGNNFDECIRLAISLGGDSDTIAAITGSIAEAYFGIPEYLIQEARAYLTPKMLKVIDKFNRRYGNGRREKF